MKSERFEGLSKVSGGEMFTLKRWHLNLLSILALLLLTVLPGQSQGSDDSGLPAFDSKPSSSQTDELPDKFLPEWLPIHFGENTDIRRHPLLYWRHWATKPLPILPAYASFLFFSLIAWSLIPEKLKQARNSIDKKFWICLCKGVACTLLVLIAARVLFLSEIGVPLAFISIGVLELALLLGLSVSVSRFGQGIVSLLRLEKEAREYRFLELAIGALLVTLLLVIPGLGELPRIGIRLVMLIAVLGLGSILDSWMPRGLSS